MAQATGRAIRSGRSDLAMNYLRAMARIANDMEKKWQAAKKELQNQQPQAAQEPSPEAEARPGTPSSEI